MPRNSGIYSIPLGTEGVPDTTVESAPYNIFLSDIEYDQNFPRPIVAGGTEASTAAQALINLGGLSVSGGTMTGALNITNTTASISPTTGALVVAGGVGIGGAIRGPLSVDNVIGDLTVARNATSGVLHFGTDKTKYIHLDGTKFQAVGAPVNIADGQPSTSVTTGALTVSGGVGIGNALYVGKNIRAGQVGSTTIAAAPSDNGGVRIITDGSAGAAAYMEFHRAGSYAAYLGIDTDNQLKIGGYSYGAAAHKILHEGLTGAFSTPAAITVGTITSSGMISGAAELTVTRAFIGQPTQGLIFFGNTGSKYIHWDGTSFHFIGGGIVIPSASISGSFNVGGNAQVSGWLQSDSGRIVSYTATNSQPSFTCYSGALGVAYGMFLDINSKLAFGGMFASGVPASNLMTLDGGGNLNVTGTVTAANGFRSTNYFGIDITGVTGSNPIQAIIAQCNPSWAATSILVQHVPGSRVFWTIHGFFEFDVSNGLAYKTGGGSWTALSDARIKDVIGNYEHGLDEVLQLQPVRYTYKGNDTNGDPSNAPVGTKDEDVPEELRGVAPQVPYRNSMHYLAATEKREFIGLVAQDCEAVMPEMVMPRKGTIDGQEVDDLRDMDTTALTYALVNAVKTLHQRVSALEA